MEELYSIGGKFTTAGATCAKGSGSVSSKSQTSGAAPTSTPTEEELEVDPIPKLTPKNASKS
ncbi:hypothetical protein Hanom_Chr08g00745031 [Helianthus anomalus]